MSGTASSGLCLMGACFFVGVGAGKSDAVGLVANGLAIALAGAACWVMRAEKARRR